LESFEVFVLSAELLLVFEMADSPLFVDEAESEADETSERIQTDEQIERDPPHEAATCR
jgi:hypothetical protein